MDHDQAAHGSLNISDVIEVLQTTDPEFVDVASNMYHAVGNGGGGGGGGLVSGNNNANVVDAGKRSAFVKIVEQPASKALRFRYECEGRSAGSIPGVNSTPENRTFPSIQVVGYHGRAVVVVSCVTKDQPYRPHPHNLVSRESCKKGVCTMELNNENMSVTFPNLGIQCVKKKDIEESLRIRKEIRVDPYQTGYAHSTQPTSIDLNAVRLCFQVFLEGSKSGTFNFMLNPIVSEPIYDKKAMSDLVICKLSDCSCSVAGGKEIILLCEKVAKEDIKVRFYEERAGLVVWEGFGDFQPTQVHKQVAISFRSPSYSSLKVENPVKANIQLLRPSDGATSESLPFEFLPLDSGRPAFWSLRKGLTKKGSYAMFSSILASNTAMLTEDNNTQNSSLATNRNVEINLNDPEEEDKDVQVVNADEEVVKTRNEGVGVVGLVSKQIEIMEQDVQVCTNSNNINDEVDKWVKLSEEMENNNNVNIESNDSSEAMNFTDDAVSQGETCKSLNELLSQVAELDVVYADTKARLLGPCDDDTVNVDIDVQDMYNDNDTYSSLQLAMKNPIEVLGMRYEDVMPQIMSNNKREMSVGMEDDSKLPPLPPKRIKKNPPNVPTRPTHLIMNTINEPAVQAPTKNLPPEPSPKAQGKPNIFQKLFSKKAPKAKKDAGVAVAGSLGGSVGNVSTAGSLRKGSVGNISSSSVKLLDGEGVVDGSEVLPQGGTNVIDVTDSNQSDCQPEVELTEAENFALYTDMAPHATASEFDEMSFYYSPVEGGKIVTATDSSLKKDVFT